MISFKINGLEYQAEEGMTWEQWVDSQYNTVGYCIYRNEIRSFSWKNTVFNSSCPVDPSDIIEANVNYYHVSYGGSDD